MNGFITANSAVYTLYAVKTLYTVSARVIDESLALCHCGVRHSRNQPSIVCMSWAELLL